MQNNTMITNMLKPRNSIISEVAIHNRNHHLRNHHNNNHKLDTSSTSPPTLPGGVDFELVSFKSASYTSLKDIDIPYCSSTILPPNPATTTSVTAGVSTSNGSGYEISIRNHLVKQAAWAYLQPAVSSSSPSSSSSRCICFSGEFYRQMVVRFGQVAETVRRGYDWLVDVLWLVLCR